MAFRPISFSIPSTTELRVRFSEDPSESLTIDNFKIRSLSGNTDDLKVVGVEVSENQVLIKTRPQIHNNYYVLEMLDTDSLIFSTKKGKRLVDDNTSRALFFIGIDKQNSIRDAMVKRVPSIFSLENTKIEKIYSAQSDEVLRGLHSIGELLSDNYVSIDIFNELRTRGSGAFDRLSNEGAYEISRVSKSITGATPLVELIEFSENNSQNRMDKVPYNPVSLQQVVVYDEEITSSTIDNSFNGYLLKLKNNNIAKLLSVKLISDDHIEDCDGNIGIDYNIERYRYSILENRYDPSYSFSRYDLKENEVLLSEFSGFPMPRIGDRLVVSYIYCDRKRFVLEDDTEVYSIESISNEPIPSNSSSFFLDNAPIVDSLHNIYEKGGLSFKVSENDSSVPDIFSKELTFNFSKLPKFPGEFSVNYETGEVFVVGEFAGDGTGRNNYYVDYYPHYLYI